MFETIGEYFAFIVPATVVLALGIIFEDKLVRLEAVLFRRSRKLYGKIVAKLEQKRGKKMGKIPTSARHRGRALQFIGKGGEKIETTNKHA